MATTGRFYTNHHETTGKYVTDSAPIDDRFVVFKQSDLFAQDTWQGRGLYSGMLVAVIRDEDSSNNGLYWLSKASEYSMQMWNPNLPNYGGNASNHGWYKLAFIVMDTSVDNEQQLPGSFGGNGSLTNPYYVSSINGGTFPPNI